MLAALVLLFQEGAPADPPRARGWDDFPVFVWRERHAGKPLPEELAEPFGGVILMRGEDSTWARERGLSYLVWNVAGRDALHLDADEAWNARVEKWIETRDESLLVREPCLNDPATVAGLFATLDETIARHGGHPGLGFVLGDEVSLTPNGDPFDLCRCGFCEAKWREYAKEHDIPERAPLTDEVRLALLEDDYSLLGAWLARRRFDRASLLDLLEGLGKHAGELADRVTRDASPLGLLGLRGQTAFGGLDVQDCWRFVRLSESYPVAEARQLEWTYRILVSEYDPWPPPSLATVFLKDESPDGAAWVAWDHWMRAGTGLVVWSDTQLGEMPAHAHRLAAASSTIRGLDQLFVGFSWPFSLPDGAVSGLAVVRDADCIAYSWLRDALLDGPTWPRRTAGFQSRRGSRELAVTGWLRAAEDAGLRPGALALRRVATSHRMTFSVLVLVHLAVLDDDDCAQLERHLDSGGVLVVDGQLGVLDRNGRRRSGSILDELRARAPERVFECASPDVAAVERALKMAHQKPARLQFGPSMAREDWLISTSPVWGVKGAHEPPEAWFVAVLPNLPTAAERESRLHDLPLEVEAPKGWSLEWIHPPREAPRILRAGDAAVVRLARHGNTPR